MDVLSNYQGFRRCVLILVFDAYKVDGEALEIQRYHNIHVVFTKGSRDCRSVYRKSSP